MKRILIVDDSMDVRELLKAQLNHYAITEATDGCDAIYKMIGNEYDAIITDLEMPKMDGEEFIRAIRLGGVKTPIFIYSSRYDSHKCDKWVQGSFNKTANKDLIQYLKVYL